MSLYEETIAIFGQRAPLRSVFSSGVDAANPCARFVQDKRSRAAFALAASLIRRRYSVRDFALRSRIRSVTAWTIEFNISILPRDRQLKSTLARRVGS